MDNKLNVGPYMPSEERKETREYLEYQLELLKMLKEARLARKPEVIYEYEVPKVGPYMPEVHEIFMPEDDSYIKKSR